MDADLIKFFGDYIWVPVTGLIGGAWQMLRGDIKRNMLTIDYLEKEINSVKIEYVQKVDFDRKMERIESKIDKHDEKLDRILERLSKNP